jgi:hypothetical protein
VLILPLPPLLLDFSLAISIIFSVLILPGSNSPPFRPCGGRDDQGGHLGDQPVADGQHRVGMRRVGEREPLLGDGDDVDEGDQKAARWRKCRAAAPSRIITPPAMPSAFG